MSSVDKDGKFILVLKNSTGNQCANVCAVYHISIYYIHIHLFIFMVQGSAQLPGGFPSLCGGRKWQAKKHQNILDCLKKRNTDVDLLGRLYICHIHAI